MMKKYRAKRLGDSEWIYGYPVESDEGEFMIEDGAVALTESKPTVSFWDVFPFDLATLSRCSGLTACGQDVYEGDILRFHVDRTTEFWTAVMRFGWHDGGYYGWYLEPIRDTLVAKRIGLWLGENTAFGCTAAVIGNVWDNPEMLGGTE